MSTKRLTVSSFALSALVAFQSAGAQERNPGQTIPSNGQPQVSNQQISATQNREGIGSQNATGNQQSGTTQQSGLGGASASGAIVDGAGTLSGQGATTATQNGITTLQGTAQSSGAQQGAYEAKRAASDGAHAGMSVQQVVVHKLMRGNQAEIELAQIAQQEAKSDEVKQFAQMMIKDHQQALQELQRQQPMSGEHAGNVSTSGSSVTASGQGNAGGQGTNGQANSGQPGNGNSDANRSQANSGNQGNSDRTGQVVGGQGSSSAQVAVGPTNGQSSVHMANMQQDRVPQQFVQVIDRTCDNSLQQSKEMLQQHRDKEFDMAYIGHQIVMHGMMLAELKALESDGPKQLQPVVQEAKRTTENHLNQAKQIAERLASHHPDKQSDQKDSNNSNRAGQNQ